MQVMEIKMKKKKVALTAWATDDGLALGGDMQRVCGEVGVGVSLTEMTKILILYGPINFTILRVI